MSGKSLAIVLIINYKNVTFWELERHSQIEIHQLSSIYLDRSDWGLARDELFLLWFPQFEPNGTVRVIKLYQEYYTRVQPKPSILIFISSSENPRPQDP